MGLPAWLAPLVIVAAAVLAALGVAEAGLRLAGFSYPNFFVPDERFGLRLRAGMEGWQQKEGEAYVRISSRGLRDRDRPIDKPAGTVRIAVLGDSFTEALQVPLEETFPALLERELNACAAFGDQPVEVLNFGVSNYGTAQQLLLLRAEVWRYSPDVVLLAFFQGNDVRNNSRALERGATRPYFVLKRGKLFLDDGFRHDEGFQRSLRLAALLAPLQELRLYQLLRKARAAAAAAPVPQRRRDPLSEPGLDDDVLRAPPGETWRQAWEVTEALIAQMHNEVAARDVRFVVATLAMGAAVYPDPRARERYAAALGVPDLFNPERRLAALGGRTGFETLLLGPRMQRYADENGAYLHGFENSAMGFGHWNETGHRVAAGMLAASFCGT